jgi:hypothetical protein
MKYYTLKLWLTTIVLSIVIFILATIILTKEIDSDFGGFAFFMFLYSFCLSIPAFFILTLINKILLKSPTMKTRISLSSIALVLMLLTVFIVFGKDCYDVKGNYSALSFSSIFAISIIISTALIKPSIE